MMRVVFVDDNNKSDRLTAVDAIRYIKRISRKSGSVVPYNRFVSQLDREFSRCGAGSCDGFSYGFPDSCRYDYLPDDLQDVLHDTLRVSDRDLFIQI